MKVIDRSTGKTYDVYPEGGGGGSGGLLELLIVITIIGIIVGILVSGAKMLGDFLRDEGILKTKIVAYWDFSEDSNMEKEDMQIVFLSENEETGGDEFRYSFGKRKDTCTIKLKKGEYTIVYEYNGEKYSWETFEASGTGKYEMVLNDDISGFTYYAAEITLYDDNNSVLCPEQLSIVNVDGDEISADLLGNGKYFVFFDKNYEEQNWVLSVEGYEIVELVFDPEGSCLLDIEVYLHES